MYGQDIVIVWISSVVVWAQRISARNYVRPDTVVVGDFVNGNSRQVNAPR
jgi:hypothetical protein